MVPRTTQGQELAKPDDSTRATTERLYLRDLDPGDAPSLYTLNSDPDVMRYTGDKPFLNAAAAKLFLQDYDHYRRFGFGRWAVIRKYDNRFLGFCGLRRDEHSGEVDLGFRFFPDYWSQGYATEAAAAALELGFGTFDLDRIVGRSMRENLPSVRVLQRLGMEFCEVREESGRMLLIYAIERDTWRQLTSSPGPRGR